MRLEKIKWGLIGCGDVTEVKSGPPLQLTEHSSLVAVMRRNGALAEDYAKRHKVPKWYTDASELINDPEVNAVYIATPPDAHCEYAIQAMKAGKAVYVEKPMARNYAECLEMIKVSEQTNVPLFSAYYRRTLPLFVKVKELVDSNQIGQIRLVNVRFYAPPENDQERLVAPWRIQPAIAGGGLLFDLASHTLDFLDFVFGPISQVKANALNQAGLYPAEDLVIANWLHQTGIAGTGTWCFTTSDKSTLDEVEIIGERGRISFSTFKNSPVILENNIVKEEFSFERPKHVQSYLMADIVAELRGEGKSPSTGISGARTSWVMDEMVKSYYHTKD